MSILLLLKSRFDILQKHMSPDSVEMLSLKDVGLVLQIEFKLVLRYSAGRQIPALPAAGRLTEMYDTLSEKLSECS